MKNVALLVVVTVVVLLASCSPSPSAQAGPELAFQIAMQVDCAETFHTSLGVHNAGPSTFEGDSAFNGQMEVRRVPSRELRASGHVVSLHALEPGDTAWPLAWEGELEAGAYELTWGAEGYGAASETFSIVEQDGRLYLRHEAEYIGEPAPEPSVAEEREPALAEAVADLTQQLDVHANEITMAAVDEAETADWQLFKDETYGFQVKMPPDWAYKDLEADGAGGPDDWPLERSISFLPQAWAERFKETNGPPKPGAAPAVPAVSLEVYVGSMEQVRRALPEPTVSKVTEIHGAEAVREVDVLSDEVQLVRYVFQDTDDPTVWVVVNDNYSGFALRRAENPKVTQLIWTVVSTFSFSR